MKKIRFIIVGAKWHDKVNGNTYNNAKILDTKTGANLLQGLFLWLRQFILS